MGLFGFGRMKDSFMRLPKPKLLETYYMDISLDYIVALREGGKRERELKRFFEEVVTPKGTMADQIFKSTLQPKASRDIDYNTIDEFTPWLPPLINEVIETMEKNEIVDRKASEKEWPTFLSEMIYIVLRGYSFSEAYQRLEGSSLNEKGTLIIKRSYFEAISVTSETLNDLYEESWRHILIGTMEFEGEEQPMLEPLKLIKHLLYSGFYYGLVSQFSSSII